MKSCKFTQAQKVLNLGHRNKLRLEAFLFGGNVCALVYVFAHICSRECDWRSSRNLGRMREVTSVCNVRTPMQEFLDQY